MRRLAASQFHRHQFIAMGIVLFALGLTLRLLNLDASPYGDEAYYFFIAHYIDAYWNTGPFPISGSIFPVFPIVYHIFAGTLTSLRVANAVVGAAAIPLAMLILHWLGARRWLVLLAALFLATDLVLVQFSAFAFLDMLGAVIALAAIAAHVRDRRGAAALLVGLATLEKEFYGLLGVALFIDHLIHRRRVYWEMIGVGIAVLTWVLLRYLWLGAPIKYLLFGHAHAAFGITGLNKAVGSLTLIPLAIAGGLYERRVRATAYFLVAYMIFLALWGNAQGWYWCLSVMVAAVLATVGAERLLRDHACNQYRAAVAAVAVLFGVGLLFEGIETGVFIAEWHDRSANAVAAKLVAMRQGRQVDLLGCDWSYPYYPFGDGLVPAATATTWQAAGDPLVVRCPGAPPPPSGWHLLYSVGSYALFERIDPAD